MKLPKEAIEELKIIHKKEFGNELSENEAQEMAMRLLRLFQLLRYKPKGNLTGSKSIDSINHKHDHSSKERFLIPFEFPTL